MKKLLVIGALCTTSALGAYAWQYTTACGVVVETVTPDFFDTDVEAEEFYGELDAAYCP